MSTTFFQVAFGADAVLTIFIVQCKYSLSSFFLFTVCSETQTTFDNGFNFRDIVEEGKSFDFSSLDALEYVR